MEKQDYCDKVGSVPSIGTLTEAHYSYSSLNRQIVCKDLLAMDPTPDFQNTAAATPHRTTASLPTPLPDPTATRHPRHP